MNLLNFYNEKLEKEMFAIIKFFIKFYKNKLNDYQRDAIMKYKSDYDINNFILGKNKSLDLLTGHTKEKSKIIDEVLKNQYKKIFQINELDNIFHIVPAYNKKIVTYRGLHICNCYPIEVGLKNMIYTLERSNIGKEFMYSTFLSTSLDINIAFYNFANPVWYNCEKKNSNKKYLNKLETTCDDLFELFGKKFFLLMKINIPKGNKFLYLDFFDYYESYIKNKIKIDENEILLPRNSKLKLVKRYDKKMNIRQPNQYLFNNILKNKVKHEKLPTRVYEFDYIGYEDNNEKIDINVFLEFDKNKKYLKEIAKQVENELKKPFSKKY